MGTMKYFCDQCDFSTNNEKGLKIHTGKMHDLECDTCKEMFASDTKLKAHMCRLHVSNPSKHTLYMKDWFVKNSCIRVYNNELQKEIALLHSNQCEDCKPCSEYPTNLRHRIRVDDDNGLIHLHGGTYFERKSKPEKVKWEFFNFHISQNDHDD